MLLFRPLAKRQIMTNGVYAKNIYDPYYEHYLLCHKSRFAAGFSRVLRRQAKFMILAKYVTMRERKNSCRAYKCVCRIEI